MKVKYIEILSTNSFFFFFFNFTMEVYQCDDEDGEEEKS